MGLYGAGSQKDVKFQRIKAIPGMPKQFSNAYSWTLLCKCSVASESGVQKIF